MRQEGELRKRQENFAQGENLLLQREAAVDGKEKNLSQVEKDVEREVEKKARETRLRGDAIEQKVREVED